MDVLAPSYLYKETRLNLESATPASTVILRLPAHDGAPTSTARGSQKRALPTEIPPAEDENAFKQKYIASAASVYYRQHHKSPRGFLWRTLENGKVLSLRVVDLCKPEKTQDASLTLRLYFPSPVRPSCIAFSDAKQHDVLSVFVLTESNHLYTLTLRPEFFRRRASTDDNVGDWTKIYIPSAFSFKHPHRLVTLSAEELLISLHDGGLLKLDRKPGEDSSSWKETFYNEGGWTQGLRSLIPFQGSHTVKVGKVNFETSAITSIAAPASVIDDVDYAFTVSLDHRIRVWNLENGKIVYTGDMLGQERLPNEIGKYMVHPSQSQLVKTYEILGGQIIAVTYSPVGAGQFKFWTVTIDADGSMELADRFPNIVLSAPPPTADVWTMADFEVAQEQSLADVLTLWILWKNNITYRVQKIDISSTSEARTDSAWKDGWAAVANEALADSPLPVPSQAEEAEVSKKWLDFMLYPGRFTTATLEAALSIYGWGRRGNTKTMVPRSTNLAQRMQSIVTSAASLTRISGKQVGQDQSGTMTDTQWRRFYRTVIELDKQRGEAMSLNFDADHGIASVITADGISAIRDCSAVERLWHNAGEYAEGPAQRVSTLISAAATFRDSFSDVLLRSCNETLKGELFQVATETDTARIHSLYEKCNFAGQIVDDDYNQLLANLGGSFKDMNVQVYEALFGAMTSPDDLDQRLDRLPLAAFGQKAFVRGVQETVELHRLICFDQLVLLAFIEGEVDLEDEGIHFDIALVYRQLLVMLKRLELIRWLSQTQITIPAPKADKPGSFTARENVPASPTKRLEDTKTLTVLEGALSHLLGIITDSGDSVARLLTDELLRVCDPSSVYELEPALIQCFLLNLERPDLAVEFSRFCDQDPFSVYIQGRAYLAAKDASTAATKFKKAAYGLAHPDLRKTTGRHSSSFLDDTEWNLLNSGLPRYYSHIVALFDKDKSYSLVIDFARLGLQFTSTLSKDTPSIQLRTELLSRLFSAALQSMRYDIAHSSLVLFTDQALQHSSLRSLIFRICETGNASQLVNLPFIGLQDAVDDILASKCLGIVDVTVSAPYHKILYAWRIKRNDFRGAASVSLERLKRLQQAGAGDKIFNNKRHRRDGGQDSLETPVTRQYLALINVLSCVDPKQAWIFSEPLPKNGAAPEGKRTVVTLEDVRRGYQEELDRIAAIENGQFAFIGGDRDEMEVL